MNFNRITLVSVIILVLGCLLSSGCSQSDSTDNNVVTLTFEQTIVNALHRTDVAECLNILQKIKDQHYYTEKEKVLVAAIKKDVADGLVTWEELAITSQGLDQLHTKNQIAELKDLAQALRTDILADRGVVMKVVKDIRQGVTNGLVTWEELGFANSEQLSQITSSFIESNS